MMIEEELHYRISWRARAYYPGQHRSDQRGGGIEFRGNVPLLTAPDPRRLDIRASLSDPFGTWLTRSFRQRSQVHVYIVADLSASLGFAAQPSKLEALADFTESLAYSAHRNGDRFGFLGCDEKFREDYYLAPTHMPGAAIELAARIRQLQPRGRSLDGWLDAPRYLGKQRALVFLISDFHCSLDFLARALQGFGKHMLVPVVLWDQREYRRLPRFGIASVRDSETGRRRTLWLRPRLHEKIAAAFAARRGALNALFFDLSLRALFLEDGFAPEVVTQYFFAAHATNAKAAA
jgi:uncharacterized protein (DUF58 family)